MLLNSDIILPSDPLASDKMGAHKTLACQASRRHQRLLRGGCERHLTRDKSKGLPGAAISNPVLPLGPLCFAEVLSGPGVSLRVSGPVREAKGGQNRVRTDVRMFRSDVKLIPARHLQWQHLRRIARIVFPLAEDVTAVLRGPSPHTSLLFFKDSSRH
ncbi:hypothetical protein C0Q70_01750 [Pomacea canaliculata]|uniref:Uncharacterized protein n=1 Tax=Pomacea canaliculata TaxID=400727 RepID=A0A2T7Q0C2_POMCA|nr:hypothetical protein C0Q70_01750 [Pomacea canaliculata]